MSAPPTAPQGPVVYRGMDQAALDAAYNNQAHVPELPAIRAAWAKQSAAALARPHVLDQRYGAGGRETLDLFFAANRNAPTLVFIHGGYWQANDKENFRFVVDGPLTHGINVALLEYTLAPQARMNQIVQEVRRGVKWLAEHLGEFGADPKRIILCGHSAGGHLTAMAAADPEVWCGLSISGLFDLQPIRLCYLNSKLGLDEVEADRNSPLRNLPARAAPLLIAYGDAELPELQRQSVEFAQAWTGKGLAGAPFAVPGANHFTVVDELARPGGMLVHELELLIRQRMGH
jgi:arylformamidase